MPAGRVSTGLEGPPKALSGVVAAWTRAAARAAVERSRPATATAKAPGACIAMPGHGLSPSETRGRAEGVNRGGAPRRVRRRSRAQASGAARRMPLDGRANAFEEFHPCQAHLRAGPDCVPKTQAMAMATAPTPSHVTRHSKILQLYYFLFNTINYICQYARRPPPVRTTRAVVPSSPAHCQASIGTPARRSTCAAAR